MKEEWSSECIADYMCVCVCARARARARVRQAWIAVGRNDVYVCERVCECLYVCVRVRV